MDECLKDGMEPKAPDKSSHLNNIDNCKARARYEPALDRKTQESTRTAALQERGPEHTAVSDLDEPGLRALLDEAISYKTPKDAQGKSDLFKELLQSVDNDNKNSMRVHSERSRKPRRQSTKKDTDKSYCSHGSLQDLNNVLSNSSAEVDHKGKETVPWKMGMSKSSSSPPQFIRIEDLIAAQRYDEANSLPRQSVVENGSCDDLYQLRITASKSSSQKHATASTSFELPEMRRTLSSGCLEEEPYMELAESYKSMNSVSNVLSSDKDEGTSSKDKFSEKTKNFDENANSLNAAQERKGKCRRLKARNDKNTILSEHIEGHRSDIAQDIDAVMKYIESPTRTDGKNSRQRMNFQKSSRIANKLRPVRDKSSDTVRKGRKSKDDKFQKSSSLEEVCISTFEDLTSNVVELGEETAIPVVNNLRKNSHAQGSDVCSSQYGSSSSIIKTAATLDASSASSPFLKKENVENDADSDFLTVRKKQRKKKTTVFHAQRNKGHNFSAYSGKKQFAYQSKERDGYSFERHSISRRKSTSSVPSSEKSEDSSDGDSVHSLPISSEACSIRSLGESCMKTASYAAIAGAAPSPSKPFDGDPDCSEKQQSPSPEEPNTPESIPTVMVQLPSRKDKNQSIRITNEDYPPLHHDSSNDMYVEYTVSVPKKEKVVYENVVNVEKTVIVKLPLKKNVTKPSEKNCIPGKRPAVIICDPSCSPCEVEDLEFGFEINQQLLEDEDEDQIQTSESEEAIEEPPVAKEKESLIDKFQPVSAEAIESADPAVAYIMEEWNKVVEEMAVQAAGGPVKVKYCDC